MIRYKRGKRKILADNKVNEIYKYYRSISKNNIDCKTFTKILRMYFGGSLKFKGAFDYMIYDNMQLRLPKRLGSVYIIRFKKIPKIKPDGSLDKGKMVVDWDKTLKLWESKYNGKTVDEIKDIKDKKLIYNLNEHTNMYTAMFYWDRVSSNIQNQYFYDLDINRPYTAKLATSLKSNHDILYSIPIIVPLN